MGRTSQDNRARIRRLALPAAAAMTLSLLFVATATGQEEAGPCSVTTDQQPSSVVANGTHHSFVMSCTGSDREVGRSITIEVLGPDADADGDLDPLFRLKEVLKLVSNGSGSSGDVTTDIHIPPIPIQQICIDDNGTKHCLPPG